ncbi:MAG TPA: alpha/beta hydrolase [Burkholderiales bacterium]|nr:alpha/beta hydrolase [Burkholderiales bacterium]
MSFLRALFRLVAASAAGLAAGCTFLDVAKHSAAIEATCRISGNVAAAKQARSPIVVVLLRETDAQPQAASRWRVVDHFVMEHPGNWGFSVGDGRYAVSAFEDRNGDLQYQPTEPHGMTDFGQPIACAGGGHFGGLAITITEAAAPFPQQLVLPKSTPRTAEEQTSYTLGQLTAVGELASLTDERFSQAHVEDGVWRPFDFLFTARAGIYFLQPYDPRKVPVLFVHGMFGSPTNFAYLIEALDKSKYQPWVYYYPSGVQLERVADHLNQTMAKLEARYVLPRYAVVAHSMGGLAARGFILRHARTSTAGLIPVFVTISSPWGGDPAASMGVSMAPAVVAVWRDMSPGSKYLDSLFARALPPETRHTLLFTFKRNSALPGDSSDRTVTVASQLRPQAQREAARLAGFDDNHDEVLNDPQVAATLKEVLARTF